MSAGARIGAEAGIGVDPRLNAEAGIAADAGSATSVTNAGSASQRALTLLICALGGEGGSVLTGWVVAAARAAGYPVQATSIPGVAQRTGATTYYIEIFPVPCGELEGRTPVLALAPTAGHVDVLLSSEVAETARALQAGYVSGCTTVITSTHRVYATVEKMAMGDGRFDAGEALDALGRCAARVVSFDMEDERASTGTVVSAVMFGALIGGGVLPIGRDLAERVVGAGGRGVEASVRGFAAGFARAAAFGTGESGAAASATGTSSAPSTAAACPGSADTEAMVAAGAARCRDYLDAAYASLYLERLAPIRALDAADIGAPGKLTRETARFLALWMCYEDIPRVAELKSRPARLERIRRETGARPGEPVRVVEYFKPGFDEVADMIPPALADRLRRWARRRGVRAVSARGLRIDTTSVAGYTTLRLLASMRRLRRRSSRYAEEQQAIERWLAAVRAARDPQLALEIALTARLIKGYSDTQQRGRASFARIMDTLIVPAQLAVPERTVAIRAARLAALAEPEDAALDRELSRHGIAPRPPKAVPIRFVQRRRSA